METSTAHQHLVWNADSILLQPTYVSQPSTFADVSLAPIPVQPVREQPTQVEKSVILPTLEKKVLAV